MVANLFRFGKIRKHESCKIIKKNYLLAEIVSQSSLAFEKFLDKNVVMILNSDTLIEKSKSHNHSRFLELLRDVV